MNTITSLEKVGYSFQLAIDYTGPDTPPPEAETLLSELAAHKSEALLYLSERGMRPHRAIRRHRERESQILKMLEESITHENHAKNSTRQRK